MKVAIAIELVILGLLILTNGALALAEMAIISARKARLQQRAAEGNRGAAVALELVEEPGDFLSTVQIGITLIGILAGAFGGATLSDELAQALDGIPFLSGYSEALSVALVVLGTTYFSLVIGELAPKRLALNDAEGFASRVARPMRRLSRILSPVAHALSLSANAVLRLVGVRQRDEPPVTEAEIKIMLEEGTKAGVFDPLEEEMVYHIFRLGDRKVSSLLTPRTRVAWIDVGATESEILATIRTCGYSRYPVAQDSLDRVLGVVLTQDLLVQVLSGQPVDLKAAIRPVPYVPEGMRALNVLERFRTAHTKIALVLDEYGGVEGLVTLDDIVDAIVGDLPGLGDAVEPEFIQREDGSWLLDGHLPLDEFAELLELSSIPSHDVDTLGGLVMAELRRIPTAGDSFEWEGVRIEVVDMDGRRVDKVLAVTTSAGEADREGEE
jgi:putative hemolysin